MMLRPTKFTNPDRTVISLSLVLIKKLKKERLVLFDDLNKLAKDKISGGDTLFFPAVNFLFLMGIIEYRKKNDSFEYVGPQ